ncbi:YggT family protein [Paramagnetospirillum magneticum]|nr:YggT family protein [Paramagnetospirillum magneticum]
MDFILEPLIRVILIALDLYMYIVIASVIASWLVAFGVINTYNSTVRTILDVIYRLTEPALRPIRRMMPDLGSVDLSPIVLWLIILFVEMLLGKALRLVMMS